MQALIDTIMRVWTMPGRRGLAVRCFVVFLFGVAHESLNVAWVHYSEGGAAGKAALVALVNSSVCLAGISESLESRYIAVCYVVGESVGTFLAVFLKGAR